MRPVPSGDSLLTPLSDLDMVLRRLSSEEEQRGKEL